MGEIDEAIQLWQKLVAQNANYKNVEWLRKELDWTEPLVEEARRLIAKL
jgi:hypothetical protein